MASRSWLERDGKLFRRFECKNFESALEFVNKVGALAEAANHHPDIAFGWGYVEVSLFTHSDNAITDKDREMADRIDKLI